MLRARSSLLNIINNRRYSVPFRDMIDLQHIPTESSDELFRPDEFNEEWMSRWKGYIYDIIKDEILLRPFDWSYNYKLLNKSMQTVLEMLNACTTFPLSDQVYGEVFRPHVESIARACGINKNLYDEFKHNFDKFVSIYATRREYIKSSGALEVGMNSEATNDFRGSTVHLLYGKVVGDALGLHLAFGAMLNPTGGIVGPDNSNIFMRSLNIMPSYGKNGILHDATGYLRVYHGIGPGYRYLELGDIRGRITPFKGIFNGYWLPKANHIRNFFWKVQELKDYIRVIDGPDMADSFLQHMHLALIALCIFVLLSQIL